MLLFFKYQGVVLRTSQGDFLRENSKTSISDEGHTLVRDMKICKNNSRGDGAEHVGQHELVTRSGTSFEPFPEYWK